MQIFKIEMYLDGGTIRLETSEGTLYIDNRIDTQTRGQIFGYYPSSNTEPFCDVFQKLYKNEIIGAVVPPKLQSKYESVIKLVSSKSNSMWNETV